MCGVSTIGIVWALARDVTVFATLETETLSVSTVNVHGVRVTFVRGSEWSRRRGGVRVTMAQGESIEETCTRWCRWMGIGMVGSGEIDVRGGGGRSGAIGLLMDLSFLVALTTVSPLPIKLDGLVLPNR